MEGPGEGEGGFGDRVVGEGWKKGDGRDVGEVDA